MSAITGIPQLIPSASATAATPAVRGFDLHPAYFAMVMATGIVSIASQLLGYAAIARVLFAANIVFYVVLWSLTLIRLVRRPRQMGADLASHSRGVGFFTIVAGTCVLGTQALLVGNSPRVATALWFLGIALWVPLTYAIFGLLTVKKDKPTLAEGINGGWLVSVVAAQSVCVLGAQLSSTFGVYRPQALFFCLAVWLGGGMLYVWIISLIFYRYTFFTLSPSDLSPPYWINMGAVAISTLAGTMLIANAPASDMVMSLLPFIKGMTLLFWATATWWIPMLLFLGIWRHVYNRFPLRYDPLYWGAVFPLGMYTSCTIRLSSILDGAGFLMDIPRVFIFVAQAAWLMTFVGLVHRLVTLYRQGQLRPQSH
jgi:tellurite resistance protein TehA-like permease